MIPTKFKVAGGKEIKVEIVDFIENKGNYSFGNFNDASNIITLAKNVFVDGIDYQQTEEDMFRTFLHELFHCFQFYSGMDSDEMVAQTFSNLMYEYINTKE